MAIQFKTEEQRKLEKKQKSKLEKARLTLMIFTTIFTVISFFYFIVAFNPLIAVVPILFLWIVVVAIPSVVTIGLIWTNDGYRNFAATVTSWLSGSKERLVSMIKGLEIGLPYIGSVTLAIIASYVTLSVISYIKEKNNKNLAHMIVGGVLFILTLTLFILAIIFYKRVINSL